MNCPESLEWLQFRLDGKSVPDATSLEMHLSGCQKCRDQHAAALVLLDGLRRTARPVPPADLAGRIAVRVQADRHLRRQKANFRWKVTLALAASLLVIASAGYLLLSRPQRPTQAPLVVQPRKDPEPKVPDNGLPALRESMANARNAVTDLTNRLAEQTREQTRLLLAAAPLDLDPMTMIPGLNELDDPLNPAAQSLQTTGRAMAEGLEVVAGSARRAVDFFKRGLPALETSRTN